MYQGLGLIFPYMEKRVFSVEKTGLDYILKNKWISKDKLVKELKSPENEVILKETGHAVVCSKGLKCVCWIGAKGVSIQMNKQEILHELSLSKEIGRASCRERVYVRV